MKEKVKQGLFEYKEIENLPNWSGIMGLQFENLVLYNLPLIVRKIGINYQSIICAAPYFQNATKANKGSCQIGLLIQTRFDTLYLCEIKCRKKISGDVIGEVKKKIQILKRPKHTSIRPVLIYEGELSKSVKESDYFSQIIWFGELLSEELKTH